MGQISRIPNKVNTTCTLTNNSEQNRSLAFIIALFDARVPFLSTLSGRWKPSIQEEKKNASPQGPIRSPFWLRSTHSSTETPQKWQTTFCIGFLKKSTAFTSVFRMSTNPMLSKCIKFGGIPFELPLKLVGASLIGRTFNNSSFNRKSQPFEEKLISSILWKFISDLNCLFSNEFGNRSLTEAYPLPNTPQIRFCRKIICQRPM